MKGLKTGGRQKGSLNKRTIARLQEASNNVGEIKRQGQRKAVEVLNDLMHIAVSFAGRHQQRLLKQEQAGQPYDATDYERFMQGMQMAGVFARELAPFQDPKFSTLKVTMPAPEPIIPGDGAKDMGKVHVIDDAAAATRVYQQMIRRIA
jgi:hypothetical protein